MSYDHPVEKFIGLVDPFWRGYDYGFQEISGKPDEVCDPLPWWDQDEMDEYEAGCQQGMQDV